jgi:hypothetical protein
LGESFAWVGSLDGRGKSRGGRKLRPPQETEVFTGAGALQAAKHRHLAWPAVPSAADTVVLSSL